MRAQRVLFSSYVSPHHRYGGLSTRLHQEADLRLILPSSRGASRGQVETQQMACVPVKYLDSQASTETLEPMKETHVHPCSARQSQRPPSILVSSSHPVPASARPYTLHYPVPRPPSGPKKDRDSERGAGVASVPALPFPSWPENSTSRIPSHSLPPPAPAIQQSAVLLPTGDPAQWHTPSPQLTPSQTPASSAHGDSERVSLDLAP